MKEENTETDSVTPTRCTYHSQRMSELEVRRAMDSFAELVRAAQANPVKALNLMNDQVKLEATPHDTRAAMFWSLGMLEGITACLALTTDKHDYQVLHALLVDATNAQLGALADQRPRDYIGPRKPWGGR